MTVDELDQLLSERFNLQRADLLAALKTLPAIKPGAAVLTEDEARCSTKLASLRIRLRSPRRRPTSLLTRRY